MADLTPIFHKDQPVISLVDAQTLVSVDQQGKVSQVNADDVKTPLTTLDNAADNAVALYLAALI